MDYNLLYEMCLYCNNWFNTPNVPRELTPDTVGDITPSFLALCEKIGKFIDDDRNEPTAITGESWAGVGYSKDLSQTAWQSAFEKDLSLYKRARFI